MSLTWLVVLRAISCSLLIYFDSLTAAGGLHCCHFSLSTCNRTDLKQIVSNKDSRFRVWFKNSHSALGVVVQNEIIGMHQAENRCKEIEETTKIGLRTIQRIIKNWKDCGEPSVLSNKSSWIKILNNPKRWSLKHFVKSDRRKSTVKFRSMFNIEGFHADNVKRKAV